MKHVYPVAKVNIKVTKDVIKRAMPGDPNACAIALALDEQLGCGDSHVSDHISFGQYRIDGLPQKVKDFIAAFDQLEGLRSEVTDQEDAVDDAQDRLNREKQEHSKSDVSNVIGTYKEELAEAKVELKRVRKELATAEKRIKPFSLEIVIPFCGDEPTLNVKGL